MARRRRKKKRRKERIRPQREGDLFSKIPNLLRVSYLVRDAPVKPFRKKIMEIREDRRRFLPKTDDHIRRDDGRRVSYEQRRPKHRRFDHIDDRLAFMDPLRVPVCQRRRMKRRILFMTGKAGKGKKPLKIRRLTDFSRIKC